MQKLLTRSQFTPPSGQSLSQYKFKALVLVAAFLSSLLYAQPWLRDGGMEYGRPFVYRQFVPLTASWIAKLTGIALGPSVVAVIIICAIGFASASSMLYQAFNNEDKSTKTDLFALSMVGILFSMITYPKHNYDVPTAFFFTIALLLLQRGNFKMYIWLFLLICLNRETALLLPVLFAVYFFNKLDRRLYWSYLTYQIIIFVVIRTSLMWVFADTPGAVFYFRPRENMQMYSDAPVTTNFFLLFLVTVLCLVTAKWKSAPALMRTAFLLFAPIITVFYFFLGTSFEIRVFVELLPVVAIISAS